MRKFVPYVCAAVIALVAIAPAKAADHPQKPGKWAIAMELEMPGMPVKMPAIKQQICLTEEDLKDPQKSVPTDPKSDCKVGDYKVDGNTVTWTIDCPKEQMTGSGEITYHDDRFSGIMNMQAGEREMKIKYAGEWLGACTK
jgi:hypothetical protein